MLCRHKRQNERANERDGEGRGYTVSILGFPSSQINIFLSQLRRSFRFVRFGSFSPRFENLFTEMNSR